ncbi:hypothetical protein Lal_00013088 [Lupinus albus]|nr:hypothetical protein Lal_00013088 [Lupinus albus]
MPREAEPSLSERTFVTQALDEGLRLDGRKFDEFRPLELTFGDEYGVAEVKYGKTRTQSHGCPSYEVNRPSLEEVLLSRLLEKTIRRSGALDTESLCLIAGQKCWSIRVDLHVLTHDGNLTDAACLAVVAALRHFLHIQSQQAWRDLSDCQTGRNFSDAPLFIQCAQGALNRSRELSDLVDSKLAEDAKRRDKGGLMAELTAENDRLNSDLLMLHTNSDTYAKPGTVVAHEL